MRNAPARKGQGAGCLHAHADTDALTIAEVRKQLLARRGIPLHRAGLIGLLAFGEIAV
jgi:hypothetical protein